MEFLAIPSLVIVLALWVIHSLILNRRLIQSQKRYHQFFNDSPVALIVIDQEYRIIEWNQTAEAIFGWESGEGLGEDILELIVPNFDKAHVVSVLQQASQEGISHSKNYNITKHGNEIFCEWRNRRLEEGDGEILCMAQDITFSQKTLDDLTKRSTALESAGDAIFYTDAKGLIEFANRNFFLLNLSDPDQVYGTHIGKYLFEDRLTFSTLIPYFQTSPTWRGTITKASSKGNKVLSVTITAIYRHSHLVSYVANLHDITQISSHIDTLTYRTKYDTLTGALNRSVMNERLTHAISLSERNGQRIALYFIDLNDFKLVNDCYGHEAGDRLLQKVSKSLLDCLRSTDTVCRYGGDEFIVILEDVKGDKHLHTIRQTIKTAIGEPILLDALTTIRARASIGVAVYPDHATDAESLIKAADMAMYEEKKKKISEQEPILCADNHNH